MIEREFIKEKAKYLKVREYIERTVSKNAGAGRIAIEKTPLGEKIIIDAIRPGLIIGRAGKTISELTRVLKSDFKLENPQIEVREIVPGTSYASVVANKIASDLERFGPQRFKAIGYRELQNIMKSGAIGAEIRVTGRGVPSSRSRSWRFFAGYMKKSGDAAFSGIDYHVARADLRSGTVGIQVRIMPADMKLPDRVDIYEVKVEETAEPKSEAEQIKEVKAKIVSKEEVVEEIKKLEKDVKEELKEEKKTKKASAKKKAAPKKKPTKKAETKEAEKKEEEKELDEAVKQEEAVEEPKKEIKEEVKEEKSSEEDKK